MSLVSLPSTTHVTKRSLTGLIILLGLVSIGFIDQSVHWLIAFLGERFAIESEASAQPGLWLFFSLFFGATSVFGWSVLYRRGDDGGRLHQGLILAVTFATATLALWFIVFVSSGLNGGWGDTLSPLETTLFILDQIARGAFFDLVEVMGWSLTSLTPDVCPWWLAVMLVIFRTMTSVASVVLLVRLLGLRPDAVDFG